MSFGGGFINSTVICNEKKSVDIDALNLISSGRVAELCGCSYKCEKSHHHFIYDTQNMFSFVQLQAGFSFENMIDLLSFAVKMIISFESNDLNIDSVKIAKEYIFRDDMSFKFIYIPIVHKPHIKKKDFILKLISVVHLKDIRVNSLVKALRKMKDDAQIIPFMIGFLGTYGVHKEFFDGQMNAEFDESDTSLLSDESETSVLSSEMNAPSFENEAETSVLSQEMSNDAETSVLSQTFSNDAPTSVLSVDPSSEGETSLLSNESNVAGYYDNVPSQPFIPAQHSESFGEGETTVLSQASYTGTYEDDSANVTAYYQDTSSECETTVLTSEPVLPQHVTISSYDAKFSLSLVRNLNGENISVDVTPFTIGKDANNMDFVLNNDSVSRHHATIVYENGCYYIMDNRSTNGTMIEGIRLQPEEKGEIGNGYIITLGNESFQAHIERR